MTDGVLAYLAIGLLLNSAMLLSHHLTRCVEARCLTATCVAPPDVSQATGWGTVRMVSEILLAIVLLSPLWPLLAYWKLRERRPRAEDEALLEKPFAVERRHLLWMTTIEEIERTARVFDPLGAVPELPFGHRHPVWAEFRDSVGPGDEVWAFSARTTGRFGVVEHREGFVIVGADGPARHFLTGLNRQLEANRQARAE